MCFKVCITSTVSSGSTNSTLRELYIFSLFIICIKIEWKRGGSGVTCSMRYVFLMLFAVPKRLPRHFSTS